MGKHKKSRNAQKGKEIASTEILEFSQEHLEAAALTEKQAEDEETFAHCPFDPSHRVLPLKLHTHIEKCIKHYPSARRCQFNKIHVFLDKEELQKHEQTCEDKPECQEEFIKACQEEALKEREKSEEPKESAQSKQSGKSECKKKDLFSSIERPPPPGLLYNKEQQFKNAEIERVRLYINNEKLTESVIKDLKISKSDVKRWEQQRIERNHIGREFSDFERAYFLKIHQLTPHGRDKQGFPLYHDQYGKECYIDEDGYIFYLDNRNYRYYWDEARNIAYYLDSDGTEYVIENGVQFILGRDGNKIIK